MQDLAVSRMQNIVQVAVVSNIEESPYNIWNSSNYKGTDMFYKVVEAHGKSITIETRKVPQLKYGAPKKINGVFEIKGKKQNGNVVVTFHSGYARLCNRFIVVASLRRPEFHLGMYEMLCFEGSKIYIFATNMGTREQVRYKGSTQRVYEFGILPKDIKPKIMKVAKGLYQYLHGVQIEYTEPNSKYEIIPKEVPTDMDEDEF